MRWMRFGSIGLAAIAVGLTLTTSSALATVSTQPVWRTCEKVPRLNGEEVGVYTESGCTTVSPTKEGDYETFAWAPGESAKLKGTGGPAVLYVYEQYEQYSSSSKGVAWEVACAKSKSVAEITQRTVGWIQITFEKCTATSEPGGQPVKCRGNIEVGPLYARLGGSNRYVGDIYEGHAQMEIGEEAPNDNQIEYDQKAFPNEFTPKAVFECGSTKFSLYKALGYPEIISPVLNGAYSNTFELSFKVYSENGKAGMGYAVGSPFEFFPLMEVNGSEFGVGLETTETLTSKTTLGIGNEEPVIG
jgi:hypothetical protein